MYSIKKALAFGFLVWLVPFIASFFVFPLKESNYFLFESIMSVLIVFATTMFGVLYFGKVTKSSLKEGIIVGLIWLAISLSIDLVLFMPESPMQMTFSLYLSQIGVKYLCIPIITTGLSKSK